MVPIWLFQKNAGKILESELLFRVMSYRVVAESCQYQCNRKDARPEVKQVKAVEAPDVFPFTNW